LEPSYCRNKYLDQVKTQKKLKRLEYHAHKPKTQGISCFGSILMNRLTFLLFSTVLLTSCATNAWTGVLAGSAIGAGAGGLTAGRNGALIGAAASAITGGIIGAVLDMQDRKVMEKSSPRTVDRMDRGDPLTLNDIIKLSQSGISDDMIVRYIKDTASTYNLSQAQIRRLQDAGVSQLVIDEMVDSGR
jgi:outer membrane lipoprotein SlyB